jgi:threonine synthase
MLIPMPSYLTHLECTFCGREYAADQLQTVCAEDARPLYPRYDLEKAATALQRAELPDRVASMWRYREVLPVRDDQSIVTLGEGWTPLLPCPRLAHQLRLERLWCKDEGQMPTGSFKARGLAMAVSRARELGVSELAIPSAGNAGGALALYAARAGLEAHVYMPADAPAANRAECVAAGAHAHLVPGLISDCGRIVRELAATRGWFDVSTLKEPYRVEGKKTMGYELAEQLGWELPDVILYPTGGGTGLVGMWKAFDEMERLGWIDGRRPRMVAVQAEGCAPIARAFHAGEEFAAPWERATTIAAGIRVPAAVADFIMLRILRASNGTAVTVTDEAMRSGMSELARAEGIFACPEGAATLAALRQLRATGWVGQEDRVVLFNTGSAYKYLELCDKELPGPP